MLSDLYKLTVLLLGLFSAASYGCDLSVRTYSLPPFATKDRLGQWSGIDMEYTKTLLQQVGCRYHFVELPRARAMEMLKAGQLDLMLNITRTPERETFLYFVGPQRQEILRLVTKKHFATTVDSWRQLLAVKGMFVRERGTFIGEHFEQLLQSDPALKRRMVYLPDNVTRVEFVLKDRAVGFFAEQTFLHHEFDKNSNYSQLQMHPLVINKVPVYYGFSKASMDQQQVERLQQAFDVLYRQKQIQAIEQHYNRY